MKESGFNRTYPYGGVDKGVMGIQFKCGCVQFQDGWMRCKEHEGLSGTELSLNASRLVDEEADALPQAASRFEMPIRIYSTGAIRDTQEGKLQYASFTNPRVEKAYANFMHKNRIMKDGTLREGDNWQKGFDKRDTLESLCRHVMDVRLHMGGYDAEATEDFKTSLCAVIFNAKSLLLEVLKEEGRG